MAARQPKEELSQLWTHLLKITLIALLPAEQHAFRVLVRELELDDLFFQTQAEGGLSQAETGSAIGVLTGH